MLELLGRLISLLAVPIIYMLLWSKYNYRHTLLYFRSNILNEVETTFSTILYFPYKPQAEQCCCCWYPREVGPQSFFMGDFCSLSHELVFM